ncbi:quinone-dependent dihydroorotate dehydrogenase [Paenibacillus sp. N1-5-1-14]|uniref:quinone-dependent dihydroorotate dehydrogenase n=1 Tax=Paenibacillus radicibacter TaxID=2972488 RepID=UPI0021591074|nr:quinone-dependent dihydroorotate dehydrogenase [Paenibacillus radicibacter]MCR8643906.1 quinone-dependent dihydroorotate dehydrogenase [Paenibacillus radicibacter]
MLYKNVGKKLLFKMDPEKAHNVVIGGLGLAGKVPGMSGLLSAIYGVPQYKELETELWGIPFKNPIGLAAGLDKNAHAVEGFSNLGFGFIEVGTVTPKPQSGNEKPRSFRLPQDKALINRMGFNNVGIEELSTNIAHTKRRTIPVVINIGKNKITPNEDAEQDYRTCIRRLYVQADFFVVNISSPNTPDLRNLQHGNELANLLAAVVDEMQIQQAKHGDRGKPILVKIAPDLSDTELESTAKIILDSGVSGIIASNTTISRDGLMHPNRQEIGGLSGKPLTHKSTEVIRKIYELTEGKLPIIGSGGVFNAQDAYDKIKAGASLVEIYTSLIYEGPGVVKKINEGLRELLKQDGYTHISQAIGAGVYGIR